MSSTPCFNCGKTCDWEDACGWCGVRHYALDPTAVPPGIGHVFALTRRWCIGDDGFRDSAVHRATDAELEELLGIVNPIFDEVQAWLVEPETLARFDAGTNRSKQEYLALTELILAVIYAEVTLRNRRENRREPDAP
jgi:hypothetical protein